MFSLFCFLPTPFFSRPQTVKKHQQQLGLFGSQKKIKMIDLKEAEQLVLDQMDLNPARHQGPRVIYHKLAGRTGNYLSHDFITNTMQTHNDNGFNKQDPTSKKIQPKVPIGINERWSADGHDKLYGIGFLVWAIVNGATGRWLDVWVVSSNCMGSVVLYLFL
jgi:hypothetical protein